MTADIRLMRWPERDRDDYQRLAAALEQVRLSAAQGRGELVAPQFAGPEEPSDLDRARALFAQRRARDAAAGQDADLFSDPAWDILLALFIAHAEGRSLADTDACATACVAPAAALRWLDVLGVRGLASFRAGNLGRRAMLTAAGHELVVRCIGEM
ncbi:MULTISPECIES: hypothetical protein [unclassified Sphingomonas]|uniref:hypothetical protein n=1 Tax=unclassified Sphingomonas TaxID=196159 RepID=UPI00226AA451|nr:MULTISPECIES: hypothetical protein [unclassified Sphingomonas]